MRSRFEQQTTIGVTPISDVIFNLKSRHSLMPVLRALQYVFVTPELNNEVFNILEKKVKDGVQNTGRRGMSLWQIMVLGIVRHCENSDYDRLHDLANNHSALRGILGVDKSDFTTGHIFHLQTLKDNVRLLDEETIIKISAIIVVGSHGLIKKKEGADSLSLRVKADSFVVESKIHFPTDLNLLWDSLRKILDSIDYFQKQKKGKKSKYHTKRWRRKAHRAYRESSEIHRKKGQNYWERLKSSVVDFKLVGQEVLKRGKQLLLDLLPNQLTDKELNDLECTRTRALAHYIKMAEKHLDLVHRRIIMNEVIPHGDKVFSIFEPHVEWNSKGKPNKKVELGHNVLIATDQHGNILYSEVYESQTDKERTINLGNELVKKYGVTHELESISFDRNFYSSAAEKKLQTQFKVVVLPKPGRQSKLELAQGENENYQNLKRKHAGIEGNINQLEQNGLDVCPDKGIAGFKRYVAYGVLSYNLHRLGMILVREERKAIKKAKRKRHLPSAA